MRCATTTCTPTQLNRPTPAVELKSLHPNHVWQIDASLCVLYYLNTRNAAGGLQVMERDKFYKNKPANIKRIEFDRVWSYEVTDHYSGVTSVHTAAAAPTWPKALYRCHPTVRARPVPRRALYLDDGHGQCQHQRPVHQPGPAPASQDHCPRPRNARATGQVEKARDLIERSFESARARAPWPTWPSQTHRRSAGHARSNSTSAWPPRQDPYGCLMTIAAEQLRVAPPVDVCQALLTETPEQTRKSPTP